MSSLGDRALGATIDLKFTTSINGVPTTLSGSPAVSVYPSGSTTEITAGVTLTVDYDSRTGLNDVSIVASGGNGFASGTDYQAVITTGTLGGVSMVGMVIGEFSIDLANVANLKSQAITAAAGVTFPSSVASPTNITAGTITTVTNLTNAPTAGDLTATMKTSVTTAATAATPTAAAVTGNVGGNVTGSVGSVLGAVGGNVNGSVGSVAGNVSGNVVGSVGSVVSSVAATVAGNVGGNVVGSVGSVIGNVGGSVASVVGGVGSVVGNVAGNVVGSVGSVTARVTANSDQLAGSATSATILGGNVLDTTTGVVGSGSTTTSIVTSSMTPPGSVANQFGSNVNPRYLIFDSATTTAALRNQSTVVSASTNAAAPVLTVNPLTTAPVVGDTFRMP